jgi:hypothetical protein
MGRVLFQLGRKAKDTLPINQEKPSKLNVYRAFSYFVNPFTPSDTFRPRSLLLSWDYPWG